MHWEINLNEKVVECPKIAFRNSDKFFEKFYVYSLSFRNHSEYNFIRIPKSKRFFLRKFSKSKNVFRTLKLEKLFEILIWKNSKNRSKLFLEIFFEYFFEKNFIRIKFPENSNFSQIQSAKPQNPMTSFSNQNRAK